LVSLGRKYEELFMKNVILGILMIISINAKGQEVLTFNDLVYLLNHKSYENENFLNEKGWTFHKNLAPITLSESKKWKKIERHSFAYNRDYKTGDVHGFIQIDRFFTKSGQNSVNKVFYTMQQLSVYNDFKSEILRKGFTFEESITEDKGTHYYYRNGDITISFFSFLEPKTSLNLYQITLDSISFN
jgi:hypothetical protein